MFIMFQVSYNNHLIQPYINYLLLPADNMQQARKRGETRKEEQERRGRRMGMQKSWTGGRKKIERERERGGSKMILNW